MAKELYRVVIFSKLNPMVDLGVLTDLDFDDAQKVLQGLKTVWEKHKGIFETFDSIMLTELIGHARIFKMNQMGVEKGEPK